MDVGTHVARPRAVVSLSLASVLLFRSLLLSKKMFIPRWFLQATSFIYARARLKCPGAVWTHPVTRIRTAGRTTLEPRFYFSEWSGHNLTHDAPFSLPSGDLDTSHQDLIFDSSQYGFGTVLCFRELLCRFRAPLEPNGD